MTYLIGLLALLLQGTQGGTRIQAGTVVRPETTTVGQHFVATIKVRAPQGVRVLFPTRPDSGAHVDSAGPSSRTDTTAGGYTESTVSYVLAAWDTGSQSLGIDSVAIVSAGGERYAVLDGFRVYVRSVLPADTSLRTPKPFRPAVAVPVFNWLPWLVAALVAIVAVLLLVAWRYWRRRRTRGLTPLQAAVREFARIESRGLVESGETERYAVEMAGVLRVYLAAVVPQAARSATTHELAAALRLTTVVPVQRLIAVLDATDLMKFAQQRATAGSALEIGAETRRIVNETDVAVRAAAAAAANAAAVAKTTIGKATADKARAA